MDDHTYMDVMIRGKLPKTTGNHVLKFKFLRSCCLLGKHELHVIYTDQLNIVSIDGVVESFEHEINWG